MNHDTFNPEDQTPTRPADAAEPGDSSSESAGFFDPSDLLISKVVDNAATPADWAALEDAAAANPSLWRDLACAQREHALLTHEVTAHLARANNVDLTTGATARGGACGEGERRSSASARRPTESPQSSRPHPTRNPWSGWLVAAALALAAAMGWLRPTITAPPTAPVRAAGWSVDSPDEAVQAYLTLGREQERVLGEMPQRLLLDSRPLDDGQRFEVVYIRRFVERAQVEDLVRFTGAEDEAGRPVAVPVKAAEPAPKAAEPRPWRG